MVCAKFRQSHKNCDHEGKDTERQMMDDFIICSMLCHRNRTDNKDDGDGVDLETTALQHMLSTRTEDIIYF